MRKERSLWFQWVCCVEVEGGKERRGRGGNEGQCGMQEERKKERAVTQHVNE
jgi:hypothetical protein